jgi:hypothetical protein
MVGRLIYTHGVVGSGTFGFKNRANRRTDTGAAPHVPDLGSRRLNERPVPGRHQHIRPIAGQLQRDRLADATACAGDHCDLSRMCRRFCRNHFCHAQRHAVSQGAFFASPAGFCAAALS